jgi:hypothetical protein
LRAARATAAHRSPPGHRATRPTRPRW